MLTSTDETITAPELKKPRKPKLYTSDKEKELLIDNLKLAVKYYGKNYLRKVFKVTKRIVIHDYMRH